MSTERMDTNTLHGKVTAAWVATYICNPDPTLAELGDACLTALGLDDLDAAVERAVYAYQHTEDGTLRAAIANALEAALTAAGEGEAS